MHKTLNICLVTGRMDAGGVPVLLSALLRKPAQGLSFFLSAPICDMPYGPAALEILGSSRCLEISHRAFRWSDVVRLFRFFLRQQIDLVSCEGKSGGAVGRIAAAIARKPCVYVYHGVHYEDYGPARRPAYFVVERVLALFTNAVVAVSPEELSLIRRLQLCPENKLRLCENGVAGPADVEPPPSSTGGLQFLHFTRFNAQKNSELLLQICDQLRSVGMLDHFRFLVIGEGERGTRDEFERKIAQKNLGKAIVCCGYIANTQSLLASSHGLISTSRWEGQPLGVLECMAAARCVVATDVVGHHSIITNEVSGLLFNNGDAVVAAACLVRLLESSELLRRISKAGRKLWESKYSIDECARRRADLYASLVKSVLPN